MYRYARPAEQNGSVLVIGMLLLLMITVLALASMSSTQMQERMAGNARMQALAFEVASAGASNALEFYVARKPDLISDPDLGLCRDIPGWPREDWPGWETIDELGGEQITRVGDHQVQLSQRIYCTAEEYPNEVDLDGNPVFPATAQLFVLSRGEVLNAAGQAIAQRDIEVRILDQLPAPLDSCTAICIPECNVPPGELKMPTAGAFRVDGMGAPAITTGSPECRDAVIAGTQEQKLGNYVGGVVAAENEGDTLGWPWDNRDDVEAFVSFLENLAKTGAPQMRTQYQFGNKRKTDNLDIGSPNNAKLTFIDGNAEFKGSESGEGILVVTGGLVWNGTPQFTGLILVLGGEFTVKGGGQGGDYAGSLTVLNMESESSWGDVNLDFSGGGTADYIYECEKLQQFSDAIYGDLTPENKWYPQCAGDPGATGLVEAATVSWRENIGWRDID